MFNEARTALVIGATRGIGAATARRLVAEGYRVAGTHRAGGSLPEDLLGIEMDLTDNDSIAAGVKQVAQKLGRLDVLVVTAGMTRDKLLMRMAPEDFTDVMQVNAIGPMLACKAALGPMMRQKGGSIVLVSSMSAKYGVAGQTNYTASKGAVEAFARSMSREYAGRGLRVNVVAPGATDTDMMAETPEAARSVMLEEIPMGRLGQAEEIAEAIVHTAQSTYMTGATIPVGGGI